MKILFVGDTHMNQNSSIHTANTHAAELNADLIIQAGNFGHTYTDDFLNAVADGPCEWWYIRGNHDNTGWINNRLDGPARHPGHPNSLHHVAPNLYWIEDGAILKIGGIRLACVGGAASIDRDDSWSPNEGVPKSALQRLRLETQLTGAVDVLLTHDIPESLRQFGLTTQTTPMHDHLPSKFNRNRLQDIYTAVRPQVVIHGHWHVGYNATAAAGSHDGTAQRLYGLGANGATEAHLLLDTDTSDFTRVPLALNP